MSKVILPLGIVLSIALLIFTGWKFNEHGIQQNQKIHRVSSVLGLDKSAFNIKFNIENGILTYTAQTKNRNSDVFHQGTLHKPDESKYNPWDSSNIENLTAEQLYWYLQDTL